MVAVTDRTLSLVCVAVMPLVLITTPSLAEERPTPSQQLQFDLDRDGEIDTVQIYIQARAERAYLRISYADGRRSTPFVVQYRDGDELWLDPRENSGDPLCSELSGQPHWPRHAECSIAISHAPYPSFALRHSRYGTILFGYDKPAEYQARSINQDGPSTEDQQSHGELVAFLPFDPFEE